MPGAPYGNPGYKESHNWETSVDIWSPTVFNPVFFAAKYGISDKSEAQLRKQWREEVMQSDDVAPNCKQGSAGFSLNSYMAKNQDLSWTGGSCSKLLRNYLKQGILAGKDGGTNVQIRSNGESEFGVQRTELDKDTVGKDSIVPAQKYSLTFWAKFGDVVAVDSNILHFGNTEDARSPALYAKTSTTNLKVSISQNNLPNFECHLDGPTSNDEENVGVFKLKQWYMIGLVVNSTGADVFVDGQKQSLYTNVADPDNEGQTVKQAGCNNPDGQTTVPAAETYFYMSDPWSEPARCELSLVKYYRALGLTEAELGAQRRIELERVAPDVRTVE
eukprot:TRINITY_DN9591_c0_g1_i3.p1 TRINITY_DN9591_c0_g1~~TRINITY_DN9591_c0_g1_i3.p1  ORF type:complete len:331 (-),score=73.26 TRINITY_DN9591_c0_g1_i3:163-1155(-)